MEVKGKKIKTDFVYPNKKQLEPLVLKYKINTNRSPRFKTIIELFQDAPTYYPWAIKMVFTNVLTIPILKNIKVWINEFNHLIKLLSKQNIISYTTTSEIICLQHEMERLSKYDKIYNMFNMFNTTQRTNLREYYSINTLFSMPYEEYEKLYLIAKKFEDLNDKMKNIIIRKASSLTQDGQYLINFIDKTLICPTFDWDMESFKTFATDYCPNSPILECKDNIAIINVISYEDCKLLGNGTPWCITKDDSDGIRHWDNYVNPMLNRKQYFMFNFSLDRKHANACIGFTIEKDSVMHTAHNNVGNGENITLSNVKDNISTKKEDYFIDDIIQDKNLDYNKWCRHDIQVIQEKLINKLNTVNSDGMDIIWDNGKIIEGVTLSDLKFLDILYSENNRYLCEIKDKEQFTQFFAWVRNRTFSINFEIGKPKTYILFDFNKEITHVNSIITWETLITEYNDYYIVGYNSLNYTINIKMLSENFNINSEIYAPLINVDDSMLFHKHLKNNNLNEAWDIIRNSKTLNVNTSYCDVTPIFMAAQSFEDLELFKAIFNHPSFNINYYNSFGDNILTDITFSYTFSENKTYIRSIIEFILSQDIDLNLKSYNGDTMLIMASQDNSTIWIVDELLQKSNVDTTIVNNCGEDALKVATFMGNSDQCVTRLLAAGLKPLDEETKQELISRYNYQEGTQVVNANVVSEIRS